jgi:uncharacterized protein
MSQENVEIVRAAFEATRSRDREAFRRLYDPDIEWEDVGKLWGDWGTRRGLDDLRDAFLTYFEAWEQPAFELERIVDAGNQVVAFVRASGRGRESGLVIDQVIPQVWTMRGGRVVRVRAYREEAEALEAAGLSE